MNDEDGLSLRELIQYLLTPARCGVYLSRADLARIGARLGTPPAPVSRSSMLDHLFRAAGRDERVVELLDALAERVSDWRARYVEWAARYPASGDIWQGWQERADDVLRRLAEMRSDAVALTTGTLRTD